VSYSVREITRAETEPFVIGIHYAKRWPSISWSFGLFDDHKLVGVCTYGTPASAPLKRGICGEELKDSVIELNRLCLLDNKKNEASYLVSASLRLLPKGKVVVTTDEWKKEFSAPACIEIKAGIHHMIEALDDSMWFCIHATDETDVSKVDEVLIKEN